MLQPCSPNPSFHSGNGVHHRCHFQWWVALGQPENQKNLAANLPCFHDGSEQSVQLFLREVSGDCSPSEITTQSGYGDCGTNWSSPVGRQTCGSVNVMFACGLPKSDTLCFSVLQGQERMVSSEMGG